MHWQPYIYNQYSLCLSQYSHLTHVIQKSTNNNNNADSYFLKMTYVKNYCTVLLANYLGKGSKKLGQKIPTIRKLFQTLQTSAQNRHWAYIQPGLYVIDNSFLSVENNDLLRAFYVITTSAQTHIMINIDALRSRLHTG